jgi:hypothetical protein
MSGPDKLIKFAYDNKGVRCWEFRDAGWVSEYDYATTDPPIRKMIEAHPEFHGWMDGETEDEDEN